MPAKCSVFIRSKCKKNVQRWLLTFIFHAIKVINVDLSFKIITKVCENWYDCKIINQHNYIHLKYAYTLNSCKYTRKVTEWRCDSNTNFSKKKVFGRLSPVGRFQKLFDWLCKIKNICKLCIQCNTWVKRIQSCFVPHGQCSRFNIISSLTTYFNDVSYYFNYSWNDGSQFFVFAILLLLLFLTIDTIEQDIEAGTLLFSKI